MARKWVCDPARPNHHGDGRQHCYYSSFLAEVAGKPSVTLENPLDWGGPGTPAPLGWQFVPSDINKLVSTVPIDGNYKTYWYNTPSHDAYHNAHHALFSKVWGGHGKHGSTHWDTHPTGRTYGGMSAAGPVSVLQNAAPPTLAIKFNPDDPKAFCYPHCDDPYYLDKPSLAMKDWMSPLNNNASPDEVITPKDWNPQPGPGSSKQTLAMKDWISGGDGGDSSSGGSGDSSTGGSGGASKSTLVLKDWMSPPDLLSTSKPSTLAETDPLSWKAGMAAPQGWSAGPYYGTLISNSTGEWFHYQSPQHRQYHQQNHQYYNWLYDGHHHGWNHNNWNNNDNNSY
jgi:hypothetical protein